MLEIKWLVSKPGGRFMLPFLIMAIFVVLFAVSKTCSTLTDNQNKNTEKYVTVAEQIVKDFNAKNYATIWYGFSKSFQAKGRCESFVKFCENIKSNFGRITAIDKTPKITSEYYAFKVHFAKSDLWMILSLNSNGKCKKMGFVEVLPIKYPKVTKKTTIDELAKVYMSQETSVGLAIGIMNNGKMSTYFYGTVKKGTDIKPDKNTEFEVGSITKTFTAIATLEMQKQELLNVNDSISKFLPKDIKTPAYDNREITIESLLTQTSGLPREPNNLMSSTKEDPDPFATNYSVKDLYTFLNSYRLTRAIGSKYEYSNLGFGLLGYILALKAGTTYEIVIKKEICDKLGMHDTRTVLSPGQKKRLALGYFPNGNPAPKTSKPIAPTFAGCGAIKSTVADMLKYLKANVTKSNSVLGKAIQESHLVKSYPKDFVDFGQASGWGVSKIAGRKVIGHAGKNPGYSSYLGFFEGTQTGVVVFSNSTVEVDGLAIRILERLAMNISTKRRILKDDKQ